MCIIYLCISINKEDITYVNNPLNIIYTTCKTMYVFFNINKGIGIYLFHLTNGFIYEYKCINLYFSRHLFTIYCIYS